MTQIKSGTATKKVAKGEAVMINGKKIVLTEDVLEALEAIGAVSKVEEEEEEVEEEEEKDYQEEGINKFCKISDERFTELVKLIVENIKNKYKSPSYYMEVLFADLSRTTNLTNKEYINILSSIAAINPNSVLSILTKTIALDLDRYYKGIDSDLVDIDSTYIVNIHTKTVEKLTEEAMEIMNPTLITLFKTKSDAEFALATFGKLLYAKE